MPIIGNPIYQSAFVVDQFSGNGSTVAFTMSVAPAGVTNVLVAVSGVLQDPSTYGVVGNTITFSAAPPSGTGNISCRYLGVPVTGVTTTAYRTVTEFTATASQTTFTPPSYNVGFINVYLNGVLLGSADYTASNGTTVVLATGAAAGNLVTVESFQVSSVLNAIPNTAGAVTSLNIASDVTINFADGSASTPSITNTGDTNTGIFFPAADTIAFAEGGVESMRVDSSGNVCVGSTAAGNAGAINVSVGLAGTTAGGIQLWSSASSNHYLQFGDSTTGVGPYRGYVGYEHGTDAMVFGTTSTDRMRIDSSGRVTTPFQPAFQAARDAGHVTNNQVVVFNSVRFNIGSNYSNSTGRFTAPVAGCYQFNAHTMLVNSTVSDHQFSLRVNGSNYSTTNPGNVPNQIAMSISEVIYLNVSDYVDVYYYDSSANSVYGTGGLNWTGFSGFLLG